MRSSPHLNVITTVIRKAGGIAVRHFDRRDRLEVTEKSDYDFVSSADTDVEGFILRKLQASFPDYGYIAEESPETVEGEFQWIIDPIDGTTNFLRGIPHFAVSIAVAQKGKIIAGAVYDPVKDELFTAERGQGAFLNGQRIRTTKARQLKSSLLATGFPVRDKEETDEYLAMFGTVFKDAGGIRRPGSAALDLAYVAAGRFDGFWEIRLSPWDMAAGCLLVREAGGMISDFSGGDNHLTTGHILAAPPLIHRLMLDKIKSHKIVAVEKRHKKGL